MRLSEIDRAVCLCVDSRFPDHWKHVRDQFSARRMQVELFLNGNPEHTMIPRAAYDQLNDQAPPPGWPARQEDWNHTRAVRTILRRALADGLQRLLFLEDDCELTDQFDHVLANAVIPEDWELLYFGAYHVWNPTKEVNAHILRLAGSVGSHAVVLRRSAMETILAEPPSSQFDNTLSRLVHPRRRSYALWPSVAIQPMNTSTITGEQGGWPVLFAHKGSNWPPPPRA